MKLLEPHFRQLYVSKGDGINPFALMRSRYVRFLGKVLTRMKALYPRVYFRLFAVGTV